MLPLFELGVPKKRLNYVKTSHVQGLFYRVTSDTKKELFLIEYSWFTLVFTSVLKPHGIIPNFGR